MAVKCFLCSHEQDGACLKKRHHGQPIKVEIKKKRSCDLYQLDPFKQAKEMRRKEKAAKIPHYTPTFRYYLTEKERAEQGVQDGPLFVLTNPQINKGE